jgi:hypothetical protein
MKKKFITWCSKKNDFFTDNIGDGDQFTNGEVLATHIGTFILFTVIFAAQALIESWPW